jgi:hypothetical protein
MPACGTNGRWFNSYHFLSVKIQLKNGAWKLSVRGMFALAVIDLFPLNNRS